MCGIGGIRRFGNSPITKDEVCLLAVGLEKRGLHATGFAALVETQVSVIKGDEQAWKFCAGATAEAWMETWLPSAEIVLVHTRFATKGTPEDNNNNHPLCAGKAAVVHNGHIHNDDFLFRDLNLERKAETDSDVLRAIVDAEGLTPGAIRALSRASGSVAAAVIHPEYPKHVLLLKSGSPLEIGTTPDKLFWGSEKHAVYTAARGWVKRFGIWGQPNKPDIVFTTMPTDTAWLIGEDGLKWHQEFKTAAYLSPAERNYYGSYKADREKWDKKAVGFTATGKQAMFICPGCKVKVKMPEALVAKWHDKHCSKCNREFKRLEGPQ